MEDDKSGRQQNAEREAGKSAEPDNDIAKIRKRESLLADNVLGCHRLRIRYRISVALSGKE